MGRIDQDLIYIPEGERLPVLEFDKIDSFDAIEEFEVYYEKYLGYFENDLERLAKEKGRIEAYVVEHKLFNWKEFVDREIKGD